MDALNKPLSYPHKLALVTETGRLIIADTGHNRVVIVSPEGEIEETIGSITQGLKDGSFTEAYFHHPLGVLYHNHKIYVADTGNHALREINLKKRQVRTLPIKGGTLAAPADLAFYPDNKHIIIAGKGPHPLQSYDLATQALTPINSPSIDNVSGVTALSDTPDLQREHGVYLTDAVSGYAFRLSPDLPGSPLAGGPSPEKGESWHTFAKRMLRDSPLKVEKLQVKTVRRDSSGNASAHETQELKLLKPMGLQTFNAMTYLTDAGAHKIHVYSKGQGLETLAGSGAAGFINGPAESAQFNAPSGVLRSGWFIYIADTNNHAIRTYDMRTKHVGELPITYPRKSKMKVDDAVYSYSLPNMVNLTGAELAAGEPLTVTLNLKGGWKISDELPSYIGVFKLGDEMEIKSHPNRLKMLPVQTRAMRLIKALPPNDIAKGTVTLDALEEGDYVLQGTLHYCDKNKGADCLVKSIEQPFTARSDAPSTLTIPVNE